MDELEKAMTREFSKCEIEKVMSVLPCTRIEFGRILDIGILDAKMQDLIHCLFNAKLIHTVGMVGAHADGWRTWERRL